MAKSKSSKTSAKVASTAAKALKEPEKATDAEVQTIAASALAQVEQDTMLSDLATPYSTEIVVHEATGAADTGHTDKEWHAIASNLSADLAAAHSRIAELEAEVARLQEQVQWYKSR